MEVLPPPAARAPGRTLPKVLLVGRRPDMFQHLEDAVRVAIPGDIIEIRTNQPMVIASAGLRVKNKVQNATLTIRAGQGYQPVFHTTTPDLPILTVFNVDLKIVGIHVAAQQRGIFIRSHGGSVRLERCSLTAAALVFLNTGGPGMTI